MSLIWSSSEKHQLGQVYQAGVVDMEGYALLKVLNRLLTHIPQMWDQWGLGRVFFPRRSP